jgi:hypothetical protein
VLGVCSPIGSVRGAFVVKLLTPNLLVMFLAPCAIGGFFVLLFAVTLNDPRLDRADKPKWSLREFASTVYLNPRFQMPCRSRKTCSLTRSPKFHGGWSRGHCPDNLGQRTGAPTLPVRCLIRGVRRVK